MRGTIAAALLAGCTGRAPDTGYSVVPPDTGAPAAGEEPGDAGGRDGWTGGPALPDCTPQAGTGSRVALSGVVLTPDGPVAGLVVYDRATGLVECAGADCEVGDAELVCTEGVISPGLVDAHDHMQYDVLGPWRHDGLFEDRYEWRSDDAYWEYRTAYDAIEDDYTCEIVKWAELRELVAGATSAIGATGGDCIDVLVRNLDEDASAHGFSDYALSYSSSNVADRYDEADGAEIAAELESGALDAALYHVAEGVRGSVRSEADHMFDIGLAGPGNWWVHATDTTTEQLARLRESGGGIVWSPRSNLDLYGLTTPADVAMRLGVPVALGPDWTWSGSMNQVREMSCAYDHLAARGFAPAEGLDVRVWRMTTEVAAEAAGLEGVISTLEPGAVADIAVYSWSAEPYRSVIRAAPDDVRLVVVGGVALYGVPDLVARLHPRPEWCESVTPCSEERLLCVQAASSGDDAQTYAELEATLSAALGSVQMPQGLEYAGELFGLWSCEETRPSCDPGEPTDGDADGDGVADADDLCPDAWDPLQRDHDGDGTGDACDPCPLAAGVEECAHEPGDVDGDGLPTESDPCPYLYDPDPLDSDGDGIGDACDPCPDEPNADGGACSTTVRALRDPDDPDHPEEGEAVRISGVVVVGVREGNGFYVQDPSATEYGGLYVYDGGAASVAVGDVVTVEGEYMEYYGLTEVAYATTTVTGSAPVPDPVDADPCDVATGGALAEPLEGMLVRVSDVVVTDANPDEPDDWGEFVVDDCLRVDDELWDGLVDGRAAGLAFSSLAGVLTWRYENSKLEPRGEADAVPAR